MQERSEERTLQNSRGVGPCGTHGSAGEQARLGWVAAAGTEAAGSVGLVTVSLLWGLSGQSFLSCCVVCF